MVRDETLGQKYGERSRCQTGFTLIEVAIVLVIVGLLLALGANFMSGFMERQHYTAASDKLSAIQSALERFVSVTGRLPCPADSGGLPKGVEKGTPGNCSDVSGIPDAVGAGAVPYKTLGISEDITFDRKSEPFVYLVPEELTSTGAMDLTAFEGKGFSVYIDGELVQDPDSSIFPAGAAYVLSADSFYDDPETNKKESVIDDISHNGIYSIIKIESFYISRLIRRPTVIEISDRAGKFSPADPGGTSDE